MWRRDRGVDDRSIGTRLTWGSPETIGERVRPYLDAGLRGLLFNMPKGSTPDDVERAGRALRSAVGPA